MILDIISSLDTEYIFNIKIIKVLPRYVAVFR